MEDQVTFSYETACQSTSTTSKYWYYLPDNTRLMAQVVLRQNITFVHISTIVSKDTGEWHKRLQMFGSRWH